MIRTFAAALFCVLSILFLLPWLILWTALTGDPEFMYSMAMKFVRFAVRVAGIRFRVEGRDNIPARGCVFACNHVSNADSLVLVLAIPRRVSILAKRGVFRIPILAIGFRQASFVPVDRRARESSVDLDAVAKLLKSGLSFLIFAEGTRSPDGRLRRFKKGAALMAIRAGAPVVPVAIAGTPRVMPKGDWRVHPGEVTVRFCLPIDASQYTVDRRPELVQRMQSAVAAALPPEQQPLARSAGDRPE
ncbi:MAG: lysophospholipid acyltransferase family protein [Candidatus Acidiferrales bacterium]